MTTVGHFAWRLGAGRGTTDMLSHVLVFFRDVKDDALQIAVHLSSFVFSCVFWRQRDDRDCMFMLFVWIISSSLGRECFGLAPAMLRFNVFVFSCLWGVLVVSKALRLL